MKCVVPQQVSGSYTLRPPVLAVIGSVNSTANDIIATVYQGEDLLSYAKVRTVLCQSVPSSMSRYGSLVAGKQCLVGPWCS